MKNLMSEGFPLFMVLRGILKGGRENTEFPYVKASRDMRFDELLGALGTLVAKDGPSSQISIKESTYGGNHKSWVRRLGCE